MTTWHLDPDHSTVGFSVRHMMVGTTRGSFRVGEEVRIEIDIELVQAAETAPERELAGVA